MTTSKRMTSTAVKYLITCTLGIAISYLLVMPSQAQQVYRIIGGDGKVTFSDKPAPGLDAQTTITPGSSGSGASTFASTLPFELRQITIKYPVTLYTADNCAPCTSARSMLLGRGVPFSEKTVKTPDDSQALYRLSGENTLPFATIGSQQLKGFSDAEWTQFLNAAGYPAASVLLPGYRRPPASPLVAVTVAPPPSNTATSNNLPSPRPAEPAANNPAGIKF